MSNVHTGVLGTGGGSLPAMSIKQVNRLLWEVRFHDTEQVFTGQTVGGALRKALEYRVDGRVEIGDNARAAATLILERLMGVVR